MIDLIVSGNLPATTQEELSTAFATVREHYEKAEQKIKLIETIAAGLYIPSVNELRYAGCHLSKATVAKTPLTITRELDKSLKHCKRAIYDALEVGIAYYLEQIKIFKEDYRLVVISAVLPDYAEAKVRISEIRDFITLPRSEERAKFWKECTQLFDEIQTIFTRFEESRDELNKIVLQQRRDKIKHDQRLAVACVGVFFAILAFGYKVYSDVHAPNLTPQASNMKSLPGGAEPMPQKLVP